jgi:hypothetical protein
MEPRALVPWGYIGKPMGCFDSERAKDVHGYFRERESSPVTVRRVGCPRQHPNVRHARLDQAALRRRELEAQLQVPQVQRIALQSPQTVKSTEPKWRRQCSQ